MKKILFLADANSIHSQKWIRASVENGFQVSLFSLSTPSQPEWFKELRVNVYTPGLSRDLISGTEMSKWRYFRYVKMIREALKELRPDILHAHYASSYGVLGRLCKYHPFILSVWGSDILEFPKRSFFHKYLFRRTVLKADILMATSRLMKDELQSYTQKKVLLTPFGVDIEKFRPSEKEKTGTEVRIGTVKALEEVYGIDILIRAFALALKKAPGTLKLEIVGEGSREQEYRSLVNKEGIADSVTFLGRLSSAAVQEKLRSFDVFVAVSRRESFGVAVLEASASALPVIVSNIGGLSEVVSENETALVVPSEDPSSLSEAILKLANDPSLRKRLGDAGRSFVVRNFDWKKNAEIVMNIYKTL